VVTLDCIPPNAFSVALQKMVSAA